MSHVVPPEQHGGKHGNSESDEDGGDVVPRDPKRRKSNENNPSESNPAAPSGSSAKKVSGGGAGEASSPAGGPDDDGSEGSAGHGNNPAAAARGLDRQALLARMRDTTTRLNALTSNNRPCNCPANCPGTGHRHQQAAKQHQGKKYPPQNIRSLATKPAGADLPPLNPTPETGHVDATRSIARVLAKAEIRKTVLLKNCGGRSARARLRVTLEVHDDPYGNRSRLGYYAQLFLTPNSDPRERAAGYISSWRISKPNARQQLVSPDVWVEEWLRRPIPEGEDNESVCTGVLMEALQRLYDRDGNPRDTLTCSRDARAALRNRHDGHEVVYIPMIFIYHECESSSRLRYVPKGFEGYPVPLDCLPDFVFQLS